MPRAFVNEKNDSGARNAGDMVALLNAQQRVMGSIAADAPLTSSLDTLCLEIEALIPGCTAAIVVLKQNRLTLKSAPSASAELRQIVESLDFPGWLEGIIIVGDTKEDPRWRQRKELTDGQSIRACWSMPLINAEGEVYGKLVIAIDRPAIPTEMDISVMNASAYVAAMALARDAKQRDQRRMMETLEATSDVILMFTPDFEITYSNDACRRLLNYGSDDLFPETLFDHFPPDVAERIRTDGIPCARRFGSWSAETTWLTCDGQRLPMLQAIIAHKKANDEIEYFSTIARDISQIKKTEFALRVSEERYRALVENAAEAIVVFDADSKHFVDFNGRALRLFGYSAEDLIALSPDKLIASEGDSKDHESFTHRVLNAALEGETPVFERHYRDGSGRTFPCEVRLSRLPSKTRRLIRGSIVDISERHRAERELHESRLRFQSIFNESVGLVGILERDGTVVDVNETVMRTTGYDRSDLTNRKIWAAPWWSDQKDEKALRSVVSVVASGKTSRSIIAYHNADGDKRWLDLSFKPMHDHDYNVDKLLFEGRDITERVSAEERLEDYAQRLHSLSQKLLRAQETERQQIAQELHDEIGQSLTVLRLSLHNMESIADDAQRNARAADCQTIVDQLLGQVRNMSLNLRPTILDDLGLFAALRWYANRQAQVTGIHFDLNLDGSTPRLPQDIESACFRIVQEAITNAMRHSGAKTIALQLTYEPGRVYLSVSDDGLGFDVAAQYDVANRQSLGLLGMHERAALVDGKLNIDSEPGKGTRISAEVTARNESEWSAAGVRE